MPITGSERKFHTKFKFRVELDEFTYAGFKSCSEIAAEVAVIEHSEGGVLAADKSPGRVTFPNVTLARGATQDKEMYQWFLQVANAAANTGDVDPSYKRTLDVVQLDRDDTVLRRWRLFSAFPSKFSAGDWDNDADENVVEQLDLAYHHFELVQ